VQICFLGVFWGAETESAIILASDIQKSAQGLGLSKAWLYRKKPFFGTWPKFDPVNVFRKKDVKQKKGAHICS